MDKVIQILSNEYHNCNSDAFFITNSFIKSFTINQIILSEKPSKFDNAIFVFPNISDQNYYNIFNQILGSKNNKIIFFGELNDELKTKFGIRNLNDIKFNKIEEANRFSHKESDEKLFYNSDIPYLNKFFNELQQRPLIRYDFAKEWNNHYYGHINDNDDLRSLTIKCEVNHENCVSFVKIGSHKIPLIANFNFGSNNLLWINRRLGLIDLPEWRIVEDFVANYSEKNLPCIPFINELKQKEKGLVTMRLDCDEDIDSAFNIFELYKKFNLPISLAITTKLITESSNSAVLPKLVLESGGTLLSHSHSHPNNWGGSKENIKYEVSHSKSLLKKTYGIDVNLAVSPFHHLDEIAVETLKENDFLGVVAGISSSHHKFLYFRGGGYSFKNKLIIHSQQCMLHGDCTNKDRPIAEYFKPIIMLSKLNFSFGFLDHPISKRYDYGWGNHQNQTLSHKKIIEFCLKNSINIVTQEELFNRLKAKSNLKLSLKVVGEKELIKLENTSKEEVSIHYKNKIYRCCDNLPNLIDIEEKV